MTLIEFSAQMVEKFGIYNINPVIDHLASTDAAYLESLREAIWKAGSHIVGFGLGGRWFYDPDPDERQKSVDYGKKGIDIAVAIGSPSVRQHVVARPGVRTNVGLAAESLGKLAEYGSNQNIVVILENDDVVSEDPFFLVQVIEKVNDPYLRALPDSGNSIRGHDEEYNERGLKEMFAHPFNMVHVKQSLRDRNGREYHVDLPNVFTIARASSYQGYFSMEFDTHMGDPYEGTQKLIDITLKCLSS
jgi:sugar phosphate isomerase/epimerase